MAKNTIDKKHSAVTENPSDSEFKPSFFQTGGGKIFLYFIAFLVGFTALYGIWRLSGGSFKPKNNCPDVATETRLQNNANVGSFAAQIEYADYLYVQCKKFDPAKEAYQKAINTTNQAGNNLAANDKAKAYLGSGLSYFYGQNDFKTARIQFQQTVALQPDNITALYMLGTTYRNDDKAQAMEYFKKVVALSPDSEFGKSAQTQISELAK
jgi:tetratricopeptide (TPR) repeat protein